jgi:PIN domain nuclease of toxin-antitoxin system
MEPGQRLTIHEGTLRDASFLPQLPGDPLDEVTARTAREQDIFLVVDERQIEVAEAGSGS